MHFDIWLNELRSPLTVVIDYLETMRDIPDTLGTLARPLEQMTQQATRMGLIVEDLLELARIENDPGGPAWSRSGSPTCWKRFATTPST